MRRFAIFAALGSMLLLAGCDQPMTNRNDTGATPRTVNRPVTDDQGATGRPETGPATPTTPPAQTPPATSPTPDAGRDRPMNP
jgi:hypothetical protein